MGQSKRMDMDMKQDLDEFRNQMEDLYHDRSVKPMKDYYRTKMEKLVKVIQAAKVLRKNPNSSMNNKPKKEEEDDIWNVNMNYISAGSSAESDEEENTRTRWWYTAFG